jgi:cardiolipin synthase
MRGYIFYINIIFILIIILIEKRNPLYTLFWITILILAPYLGFVLYLLLGLKYFRRRRAEKFSDWKSARKGSIIRTSDRPDLLKWKQLISYLEISTQNKLTKNNRMEIFIRGPKLFERMIEDLKNAEEFIFMEYYIFHDGQLTRKISEILIEKARAGKRVKLIIDGASTVRNSKLKELRKAGCEVKRFFPWNILFLKIANLRVNYRDHRKLTVIDGKIGYTGGFNIGDEYLGKGPLGPWRDTAIRISGECVRDLQREFMYFWGMVTKTKSEALDQAKLPVGEDNDVPSVQDDHGDTKYLQVVSSGPNYDYRTMRDNFLKIILEAQRYICIQTPYFVPDEFILEALRLAATSGVNIKIMIPEKADHIFMKWVNQYFAGELLDLGVEIYRYQKGFIHSKLILADNEIVSVGSANMDYRSLYQNFEVNVNIYDEEIVRMFHQIFKHDIRSAHRFSKKLYSKRDVLVKLKESVFRLLAPIL